MELKLENLTKRFRETAAVDGVSCKLTCGVYGLLGVNGAGKTTLMRMLCTLMRPTSGSISWNGREIFALDAEYRAILGYLPQDFGFYPDFTVDDYLGYVSSIKGLRPATARARSKELLHELGLEKYRNRKMKKLSGGMKRRVGIAQAMLNDPRILVLDEPTAGLDPGERIRFRNLVSELAGERIVLLSTHIVSDVAYIANEILLMKEGRIVRSGAPEELTSALPERVWSCAVPRGEIERCLRKFRVANVRTAPGGAELRVLAPEAPMPGAQEEPATLEDVFLHYFGEKGDGEDAAL